jgi:hypothetical protein
MGTTSATLQLAARTPTPEPPSQACRSLRLSRLSPDGRRYAPAGDEPRPPMAPCTPNLDYAESIASFGLTISRSS